MGVHLGVPPLGFLGPQLSVLLFGKLLQTVQQSPGQSRARLRVEFEGFARAISIAWRTFCSATRAGNCRAGFRSS